MSIFDHHIYEYEKGLRNLILYTENVNEKDTIEKKLRVRNISSYIQPVNNTKINIFFGDSVCIEVVKQLKIKSLSGLTKEQDFILGIMLGYDRLKQCNRYLKRKKLRE